METGVDCAAAEGLAATVGVVAADAAAEAWSCAGRSSVAWFWCWLLIAWFLAFAPFMCAASAGDAFGMAAPTVPCLLLREKEGEGRVTGREMVTVGVLGAEAVGAEPFAEATAMGGRVDELRVGLGPCFSVRVEAV
eukprot:2796275-Pleurochrysis_carterae.AAC.2